jgi:hypothetical protein
MSMETFSSSGQSLWRLIALLIDSPDKQFTLMSFVRKFQELSITETNSAAQLQ